MVNIRKQKHASERTTARKHQLAKDLATEKPGKSTIKDYREKFKLFIKACHLLALISVQSFASNIEDNFWTSTTRRLIAEYALQEDPLFLSIYPAVPSREDHVQLRAPRKV